MVGTGSGLGNLNSRMYDFSLLDIFNPHPPGIFQYKPETVLGG
jgi:hypothetical protein